MPLRRTNNQRRTEEMGSRALFEDYDGFVEKFKSKKTTDDCYTPPYIYDAVLSWLGENYPLAGCNIVRPFWPGGDFESVEYGPDDVVVDNPPFSILARIVRWYNEHGVRYFLFAPYLTCLGVRQEYTAIVTNSSVIYENGAQVNTAFVSNLFPDLALWACPELKERIEMAQIKARNDARVAPLKYDYPLHVVTATMGGYLASHGVDFKVPRSSCVKVSALASQKAMGKAIFGSGLLVSDSVAEAKAEAKAKAEAEAKAKAKADVIWELNDVERLAIERLNRNEQKETAND